MHIAPWFFYAHFQEEARNADSDPCLPGADVVRGRVPCAGAAAAGLAGAGRNHPDYPEWIQSGKMDDSVFRACLLSEHEQETVENLTKTDALPSRRRAFLYVSQMQAAVMMAIL